MGLLLPLAREGGLQTPQEEYPERELIGLPRAQLLGSRLNHVAEVRQAKAKLRRNAECWRAAPADGVIVKREDSFAKTHNVRINRPGLVAEPLK